ncbi:hypothetical protein C7S15_1963 [Burkholderia cepacia]|nr:hypothetical protein [Burkholderia cepacia]
MPFPIRSTARRGYVADTLPARGGRVATGPRPEGDGWSMCIHL